jgi:predicted GIY-YIG superfamily endonuclease
MAEKRDWYTYYFKVGNKIVHGGRTQDLERREEEHRKKWPTGHIFPVGERKTEDGAIRWERRQGFS